MLMYQMQCQEQVTSMAAKFYMVLALGTNLYKFV